MNILVVILVVSAQIISSKCESDYCNLPSCLNKTHLMCKPMTNSTIHPSLNKEIIDCILGPLNEYRNDLRRFQYITNLLDFEWNNELAEMAREILHRKFVSKDSTDYCTNTANHKNILQFNHQFTDLLLIKPVIVLFFENLTKSINPETNWMGSAYSNQIGCSKSISKRLVCLINGVELKYASQSYVYDKDHDYRDETCRRIQLACNDDHFICTVPDEIAVNAKPWSLDDTSAKFILYKFELDKQIVTWDYDLQHIAEHIVTNNLTTYDKCVARLYPKISKLHINGAQYFREQISNIDSVWKSNTIKGGIGCAAFTTTINGLTYFNLYCLTGNGILRSVQQNFVRDFLRRIKLGRSDCWLIYVLLILTYLNIIAALVLMHCLKIYELTRILNSF